MSQRNRCGYTVREAVMNCDRERLSCTHPRQCSSRRASEDRARCAAYIVHPTATPAPPVCRVRDVAVSLLAAVASCYYVYNHPYYIQSIGE